MLGLERIEQVLAALGKPQLSGMKYLHIGGTNGKGSTAAMAAAVWREAGLSTGLFTSPHLNDYRERLRIDGRMIEQAEMSALTDEVKDQVKALTAGGMAEPTEFEITTALALLYFARRHVDWAVLEVGLGGRLDSTNVVLPEAVIITGVDFDHMNYLGNTIEEIAGEKAGIIKDGIPVVCGCQRPEAAAVIAAVARSKQAPFYLLGRDFGWNNRQGGTNKQKANFYCGSTFYKDVAVNLWGRFQLDNAACAVMAAQLCGIGEAAIRKGLATVRWPGRLEVLSVLPPVVLDGAHNEQGMAALSQAITEYWPRRRIVAVLSMLDDKNRRESLRELTPHLKQAVVCPASDNRRSKDWRRVAEICEEQNVPAVTVDNIAGAVAKAGSFLVDGSCDMLLVGGSLYMLAGAREELLKHLPDQPFILASGSPRRRELLTAIGADFIVQSTDAQEISEGEPRLVAMTNAVSKARAAFPLAGGRYVLAADTIVVLDGKILGKPAGAAEASVMLHALSGREHTVITAVALLDDRGQLYSDAAATQVLFGNLSNDEIDAYVASGEPLDKAGAYGAQGEGGRFIVQLKGSYSNVVGLPLFLVCRLFAQAVFKM